MNLEQSSQLRAPFAAQDVGKLPKITCPACSKATGRVCPQHQKTRCQTCSNWITGAHTHLDYVGHAAVTNRLLTVDPAWNWEPVAWDDKGLPAIDNDGGLWIRLTVLDVTRLGYGHADGKKTADARKEAIGDAIRNAAMRFGVAVDLWHKGQLSGAVEPTADTADYAPQNQPTPDDQPAPPPAAVATVVRRNRPTGGADIVEPDQPAPATQKQINLVMLRCNRQAINDDDRHALVEAHTAGRTTHVREMTGPEISALIDSLNTPEGDNQ